MSELRRACFCLGSNIQPEANLRRAVELLQRRGRVPGVSHAWESAAVGSNGPNFLNACALFETSLRQEHLVEQVIRPIEAELGRERTADRYAPRRIDIDLVLYVNEPVRLEYWEQAFMIVPLSELLPEFEHPLRHQPLSEVAAQLRRETWIEPRMEVLATGEK